MCNCSEETCLYIDCLLKQENRHLSTINVFYELKDAFENPIVCLLFNIF